MSFQLASWLPAWWCGRVGGDDILELAGPTVLPELRAHADRTTAVTAFCPDAGVDLLPGPRATTEAAVAAGQAVILHSRGPATLVIPQDDGWEVMPAGVPRPLDLDLRAAEIEMAEAVLAAEQEIREAGLEFTAAQRPATARPLPPGADPSRQRLLVRAVRIWNACAAVPVSQRTPAISRLVRAAARATLSAYSELEITGVSSRQRRFA